MTDEDSYWHEQAMDWKRKAEATDAEYAQLKHDLDMWKAHLRSPDYLTELDEAKAEIARLHQAYRDEAQLRVALKPDTGGCEHCKDYVGKCPYCHRPRPKPDTGEDGDVELAEFRAWKDMTAAEAMPRTTKVEGGYKHEWIDADGVPHAFVSETNLTALKPDTGEAVIYHADTDE